MSTIDAQAFYTNKNYYVILLDNQMVDEKDIHAPPLSYGVYNRCTDVMESYHTYLPAAIQTANGLSDVLEELLPNKEVVVDLQSCVH